MNKSRGSGRPAREEAAADAGYASGTWRRAASLSGQVGAGGRTDVELLILEHACPLCANGACTHLHQAMALFLFSVFLLQ